MDLSSTEGFQISLHRHKRPITDLQFNRDGDLLFSASKDSSCCLWRCDGTILGTYDGHDGAVTSLAITKDSHMLLTGGGDRKAIIWDVVTGKLRYEISLDSIIKGVCFYPSDKCMAITCDDSYKQLPIIGIYDTRTCDTLEIFKPDTVPTKAVINRNETKLVYSDTQGNLNCVDLRTNKIIDQKKVHTSRINSLKTSFCETFFITGSSDAQSKIIDFNDLEVKKVFTAEEPINSATIFVDNLKVVCCGGLNARDVTSTRGKSYFEVNFYDVITAKKVGAYGTHFGTINSVDVNPNGEMYASGGEDGLISIVKFGEDFKKAPFTWIK
ncbi:Eukaryotic translation initiation factor 3 subunit I [Astathelohania contejeani]|uniref:Serine-threonine kinase receptor-associated protein n=1 Tax=Astathelohania contejeani TaxID=164912 RepID=A0ABQ7HZA1_9MICR|nr:Eukaryotic translation initiation factor 3 subunit I [Thelohania contejeani]